MAGVNLATVQQLLGHKTLKMTMRYRQLSQQHLQEAVALLSMWISAEVQEQIGTALSRGLSKVERLLYVQPLRIPNAKSRAPFL
ncbi:hypothetical protein E3J62_08080 [candidate division TA06 bacterium]|uniref:Tyr recombinase domain-containing protein n=1 Tax=candidate division TA06 bacterium TaxID=2250710 RepID=A0A523URU2_UNCT6|nr:MAG: hypothetical protein E3J62_08080 [candidate division TA06 bacterium]